MAKPPAAKNADDLGLADFAQPAEQGLSLDALSQAFAAMLNTGSDPYTVPSELPVDQTVPVSTIQRPANFAEPVAIASAANDGQCEISPRSILEAMLFVGLPGGQPLTSPQVAGLMRGVRPVEIDELVCELNLHYEQSQCPYRIESVEAGYRLILREEFSGVRDQFYGRVRQAKLSPAAIEVLATVAYNQPLTSDDVSKLRGAVSGSVLSQLVRRELLRLERDPQQPRVPRYRTTDRFLNLFGLESLADLPNSSLD